MDRVSFRSGLVAIAALAFCQDLRASCSALPTLERGFQPKFLMTQGSNAVYGQFPWMVLITHLRVRVYAVEQSLLLDGSWRLPTVSQNYLEILSSLLEKSAKASWVRIKRLRALRWELIKAQFTPTTNAQESTTLD